jgi:hypothetical protein
MILVQATKPATYQVDDQLMVVVFQQYLKSVRFTEPKTYRIVGREHIYLFRTEPAYDEWEPSYVIESKAIYNCKDLQVLITLADFLNKPQS